MPQGARWVGGLGGLSVRVGGTRGTSACASGGPGRPQGVCVGVHVGLSVDVGGGGEDSAWAGGGRGRWWWGGVGSWGGQPPGGSLVLGMVSLWCSGRISVCRHHHLHGGT